MEEIRNQLEQIKKSFDSDLENAYDLKNLEEIKTTYLGKKAKLSLMLRQMRTYEKEERALIGQEVNKLRDYLNKTVSYKEEQLKNEELEKELKTQKIDITEPSIKCEIGSIHPITQIIREVEDIFLGMGYTIADGPEIEKAYYNFTQLNAPEDHPSRDLQDTFYITDEILLRTQTSPVQARVMENNKPPIKIISPGVVYRSDTIDATHSPVFHQMEGLVVDKNISMANLKATLEIFAKKCLGENVKIRFRPHHFPFTEPSAEADVSCFVCGGKGCKVCKGEGWIELLGCGMVHPNVLKNCGIDPDVYSGFAFGFGIERVAMAKFGIDDLRLLYENDQRFLKQF